MKNYPIFALCAMLIALIGTNDLVPEAIRILLLGIAIGWLLGITVMRYTILREKHIAASEKLNEEAKNLLDQASNKND